MFLYMNSINTCRNSERLYVSYLLNVNEEKTICGQSEFKGQSKAIYLYQLRPKLATQTATKLHLTYRHPTCIDQHICHKTAVHNWV